MNVEINMVMNKVRELIISYHLHMIYLDRRDGLKRILNNKIWISFENLGYIKYCLVIIRIEEKFFFLLVIMEFLKNQIISEKLAYIQYTCHGALEKGEDQCVLQKKFKVHYIPDIK